MPVTKNEATKIYADVIVLGGGNAALCAALAAAKAGASVILLEAATEAEAGGNSWFTDGAMRFAFGDFAQLRELLSLSDEEAAKIEIPPYSVADYFADLQATGGNEKILMRTLAEQSFDTMCWLRNNGIVLELITDNQSHQIGDKRRFFGNLNVRTLDRGIGLINTLHRSCQKANVKIVYQTRARKLLMKNGRCSGVCASTESGEREFLSKTVILASGGFEANESMRADYLGEAWRHARVRGSRYNVGDGLLMALDIGAARAGDWRRCHAVGTDYHSPPFGDFSLPGDIWKKHSYPYGIIVNQHGLRFVDEGADLRNYTYAKYGQEILRQSKSIAWQIFDSQTESLLRSEYRHKYVAQLQANTFAELAEQMDIDREQFLQTLQEYNRATEKSSVDFNPAVLDGKSTHGLAIPKSHWAVPICQAPYFAFAITCGITFTFGGIKINTNAQLLGKNGIPIDGVFAAGEMVGGIFGNNYPGGSGLMSGSVFGRIAGNTAAKVAQATI